MPTPVRLHSWPYPKLIAHRGAGLHAPENTLSAMRMGVKHGFRMVEFDVKLSADNIAILLHDDTLDRTSNATGLAAQYSLHELLAFDFGAWLSPQFVGEPILSLRTLASYAQSQHLACNIEIKPTTGHDARTGRLVAEYAASWWANAATPPLLSSFSEAALASAQLAAPHLPRALLFEDQLPTDWYQRAQQLGCCSINMNNLYVTRSIIADIIDAGLAVCVWTVNDVERIEQLLDWGCQSIFTDAITLVPPELLA